MQVSLSQYLHNHDPKADQPSIKQRKLRHPPLHPENHYPGPKHIAQRVQNIVKGQLKRMQLFELFKHSGMMLVTFCRGKY